MTTYLRAATEEDEIALAQCSVKDPTFKPVRWSRLEVDPVQGRAIPPLYYFDTQRRWERLLDRSLHRAQATDSLLARLQAELLHLDLDYRVVLARYRYDLADRGYVRESRPILGRKVRVGEKLSGMGLSADALATRIRDSLDSLTVWTEVTNALRLSAFPKCVPGSGATYWSQARTVVTLVDPSGEEVERGVSMTLVRVPMGRWIICNVRMEPLPL